MDRSAVAIDAHATAPFRLEPLAELTPRVIADLERAVAEKRAAILRAVAFVDTLRDEHATEAEVRVWLEPALAPAQVCIHYEPPFGRYYVLILDLTGRERLAALHVGDVPCVSAAEAHTESARVTSAVTAALRERADAGTPGNAAPMDEGTLCDRVRAHPGRHP